MSRHPLLVVLLFLPLMGQAAELSNAQVRSAIRGLSDAAKREATLAKYATTAERQIIANAIQADLDAAVAQYRAGRPDEMRQRIAEVRKTSYEELVAQKSVVGKKFPTKETKPAFLRLVEIHERYFAAAVAWQQQVNGKAEVGLRELSSALRAVQPGASVPDVDQLTCKDLDAALATFIREDEQRWHRAKQIYLFNRTQASWAADYQVASAEAHNGYRLIHNLVPFELEQHLDAAAQAHADEMAAMGYFGHNSPVAENKSWNGRIKKAGYPGSPGSENLAMGSGMGANAASVMASVIMWFWDPHHNPLVNPGFNQLGTGAAGSRVGCSYGTSKNPQSTGLDVSGIDLAKLIVIDYARFKSAFGG